ncbi:hypothetical protein DDZ16_02370 [Marinilabilia rubra]|uniref:Uncharacterized protein n=1 Tax=Marinilabilia rubra TaxID=2162893 RepID=A0A2U2BE51_9BACT|nr:hypothetical protein DDZ16_02370 [Marinilabilia rubra]
MPQRVFPVFILQGLGKVGRKNMNHIKNAPKPICIFFLSKKIHFNRCGSSIGETCEHSAVFKNQI